MEVEVEVAVEVEVVAVAVQEVPLQADLQAQGGAQRKCPNAKGND